MSGWFAAAHRRWFALKIVDFPCAAGSDRPINSVQKNAFLFSPKYPLFFEIQIMISCDVFIEGAFGTDSAGSAGWM
jgi:hypothetical protein